MEENIINYVVGGQAVYPANSRSPRIRQHHHSAERSLEYARVRLGCRVLHCELQVDGSPENSFAKKNLSLQVNDRITVRGELVRNERKFAFAENLLKMKFKSSLQFTIGERLLAANDRSLAEIDFSRQTKFLANRSPVCGGVCLNPGRIRANSAERLAYSGERSAECRFWRTVGEFAQSSLEFARIRGERDTLLIRHYTLHTTHFTLHTTNYTLHTTHYTLHSTHYTTHYTLHTTQYTLHTTHYTLPVCRSSKETLRSLRIGLSLGLFTGGLRLHLPPSV